MRRELRKRMRPGRQESAAFAGVQWMYKGSNRQNLIDR
jgi:hypothetical protein